MTAKEIVANCNALARQFYLMHGHQVPEGYRFDQAHHPQERAMWAMAVLAYDEIEGTDVESALDELEDESA